ncbi:hypothetical protein J5N97_017508 [Dioscorea zingiberensis]|uniref:Saposin B-type domain-containing protein n=1 Tax=Dioscorea zingiberensis TaxID=325984 RepID=A0A9D5HGL8_9LILI|nr:hypothetical protein J5N97_017508 [Dioscorea zingiberensis]
MLAISWMGSDARQLAASDMTSIPIEYKYLGEEIKIHVAVEKNNQSLEEQCAMLVDTYASAFFSEISTIQPEEFCQKVNLCRMKYVSLHRSNKTCELCHQVMIEVITKLKDPDTQFEIIEILLKQCNKGGRIMRKSAKGWSSSMAL